MFVYMIVRVHSVVLMSQIKLKFIQKSELLTHVYPHRYNPINLNSQTYNKPCTMTWPQTAPGGCGRCVNGINSYWWVLYIATSAIDLNELNVLWRSKFYMRCKSPLSGLRTGESALKIQFIYYSTSPWSLVGVGGDQNLLLLLSLQTSLHLLFCCAWFHPRHVCNCDWCSLCSVPWEVFADARPTSGFGIPHRLRQIKAIASK